MHSEPTSFGAPDLSIRLPILAAEWKCEFPEQVHFLQSNHELAQLTGHEITKGGRCVLADFARGVVEEFGREAAGDVLAAHRVPPQLLGVVPANTGGFGDVEKAEAVFMRIEIEPLKMRFLEINDWLGVEAVRFKPYEPPVATAA